MLTTRLQDPIADPESLIGANRSSRPKPDTGSDSREMLGSRALHDIFDRREERKRRDGYESIARFLCAAGLRRHRPATSFAVPGVIHPRSTSVRNDRCLNKPVESR